MKLPNISATKESTPRKNTTGLNSLFSFFLIGYLTKTKERNLPMELGFMPFTRALTRITIRTASFKIWTRVTDSISYDNNRYAKRN